MIDFSRVWPVSFEDDDTVIRHELGHALVWLVEGGQIDRIRFWRTPGRLLAGSARIMMPDGISDEEQLRAERAPQIASRALAGEIAAREYLGEPPHLICTDLPVSPSSDLCEARFGSLMEPFDDVKALRLAQEAAGSRWYEWLCERHSAARAIVVAHFDTLDTAADVIHGEIPLWPGEELLLSAERVTSLLRLPTSPTG